MKVFVLLCVVGAAFAVHEPFVHTCLDRPDPGMCLAYFPSYYYDAETGTCKEFIYGGCQGNGNRYPTEEDCLKHCEGVQVEHSSSDVCSLDKEPGMCLGYFPRYYYDKEAGECKRFIYGGCQGNGNNFKSIEECQSTCASETQAALDRPDCDKPAETGECRAYIPRYYYDQEAGMCKKFIYGGCGGNRNNFKSEDECYNKCGALMGATACQQDKEVGPCRAAFPRYYFNKQTGQCERFIYGGCEGNDNNFNSKDDCEAVCLPQSTVDRCSQEPETGLCRGYFPSYYFDKSSGTCKEFIYGGCGGNENRFATEDDCLDACSA